MTPNYRLLFDILRVSLGTSAQLTTHEGVIDWDELYQSASIHGVLALTWDVISSLPIEAQPPRDLRIKWAYNVSLIEQRYKQQVTAIGKLAQIYSDHGIKMMLLKGYGLSLCYPKPNHRPCGDIDIWLYGERKRADNLLRERGIQISEDEHHHTVFSFNNVMVENHYDFLNIHAHTSNRIIEQRLKDLAYQSNDTINVNGQIVYIPNADFNALFLLRHAAAHFAAAEIGLRHVVDWAMFVDRYHEQVDWLSLYEFATQQNMHKFLYCMNAISIDYMGLNADKIPPFPRDKKLERRVIEDILHPEFDKKSPKGDIVKVLIHKLDRWWANRWKHQIVYREGLLQTFFVQLWSHMLKPKSFTK